MTADGALLTERLRLRPLGDGDAKFVTWLLRDNTVRRYLGGAVDPNRLGAALDRYLDLSESDRMWLVEARASWAPLGLVSLTAHEDGEDTELSYQLDPSAWGQGYATEAVRRALEVAHHELGLARVIAETQAANLSSRRLLGRLGMIEWRCVERFGCEQVIYAVDLPAP